MLHFRPRRRDAGYFALSSSRVIMLRLLAGLLIISAILLLIHAAAARVVEGAASTVHRRATLAIAVQHVAADYRKARAKCQRLPTGAKESCIVDAHVSEDRARTAAALTPESYLASLRAETAAAIDAGDNDTIVVEPACNIVSRGTASVCEIQILPGTANALIPPAINRSFSIAQIRVDRARSSADNLNGNKHFSDLAAGSR